MKKRWIAVLALSGVLALTAACGKGGDAAEEGHTAGEDAGDIAAEYPDSSLTRAEIAKIVWVIGTY